MTDEITATLLKDRTTGRNIIWATEELGAVEITPDDICKIIPRHAKNRADQKRRTRARAEIFTPPEVCRIQNDLVCKPFEKRFDDFIDAKFLEITCGEAPYITSRNNAVTGEYIAPENRVGLLDRKFRLIGNTKPVDTLTLRALKSVYGYEFQGDNLFLARRNIFDTVAEFLTSKLAAQELREILPTVAEIISWNFWQMDGLKYSPPFTDNANLFGGANCQIMDWDANEPLEFVELIGGGRR